MDLIITELSVGDKAIITGFDDSSVSYRDKLLSMGLVKGVEFAVTNKGPLGDPIEIQVMGYALSLRKDEAKVIRIRKV